MRARVTRMITSVHLRGGSLLAPRAIELEAGGSCANSCLCASLYSYVAELVKRFQQNVDWGWKEWPYVESTHDVP